MNNDLVVLVDRYNEMLNNFDAVCEPEPGTSLSHIKWMLSEILLLNDREKQMRWMGFIQAIIIINGYTTVTEERNYTRPLFTGIA